VNPEAREQSRQSFIADAIELLNRSLDFEKTLASLAWVAVPTIADWCAVDVLEGGKLQRLAVAHTDPAKVELAKEYERRWPVDLEATTGVPGIIRSGRPELFSEITDEMIEQAVPDRERREALLKLGIRSYIGVPLRRGNETIGAITLIMAESGRRYDSTDLALAVTLADRASAAIANAQTHEEARAERDRLALLIASSPMAIAILRGPELVFEMVNPPFERTFGGRKLRGIKQSELDPTGASAVDLKRVYETGVAFEATERASTYDWDGTGVPTTRYFDFKLTPMRDAAGNVDGVLVFSIDVTDKVTARQAIEEARAQAEEANRAKDEFLAMLGHELRNPLAPILTALELMQLRAPESCERERTVIGRQVKHVVRLVDDLLDVSRITRGNIELEREEVDVADSIGKAIEMASPLLEERRHELVTSFTRGLYVSADPVRLAQVLANLLTNAAKYTERGGKVEIAATREGDHIVIRVADNGVGIAPEVLPHVFDTFYQSRQSIDRAHGGLGLGLAIVRMLVDLHGGQVFATSDGPGKGSEFSVWLPALVAATRSRPALGTPIKGAYPLHTEGVLIVDDNVDALALLADALESRGWLIHRAHDAPSAIALAQRTRPKVAMLDIGLPVMDGYELGRRLRELPGLADILLVAVTGYGTAADVEKSRVAGFLAHLVKPISLDTVQVTLEQLLGGQARFAARSG
jgi:signal transduction histidine kinase/ActR/RegA family two-component response regulator